MLQKKIKKMLIFTGAPQGTSGDLIFTCKFMKSLLKSENIIYEFTLLLGVEDQYKEQALSKLFSFFKKEDINLHTSNYCFDFFTDNYQNIFLDSDVIVSSMMTRGISPDKLYYLKQLKKDIFVLHEYSFDITSPGWSKEHINNILNGNGFFAQIMSGFGEEGQGVFFDDVNDYDFNVLQKNKALAKLFGNNENEYFEQNTLYTGYVNNLGELYEYYYNAGNLKFFILLCLKDSILNGKGKRVDIAVNLSLNESSDNNIKQILPYIEEFAKREGNNIKVEVVSVNKENEILSETVEYKAFNNDFFVNLRILNIFPANKDVFNYLLSKSNDLVLVTGDQSMCEALSHNKVFLYQAMGWKFKSVLDLESDMKEIIGPNSLLYKFLYLQHSIYDRREKNEKIKEENFWKTFYLLDELFCEKNAREKILKEIDFFKQNLMKDKNLYNKIYYMFDELLSGEHPEKYIDLVLNPISSNSIININNLTDLVADYPDKKEYIILKAIKNIMSYSYTKLAVLANLDEVNRDAVKLDMYKLRWITNLINLFPENKHMILNELDNTFFQTLLSTNDKSMISYFFNFPNNSEFIEKRQLCSLAFSLDLYPIFIMLNEISPSDVFYQADFAKGYVKTKEDLKRAILNNDVKAYLEAIENVSHILRYDDEGHVADIISDILDESDIENSMLRACLEIPLLN